MTESTDKPRPTKPGWWWAKIWGNPMQPVKVREYEGKLECNMAPMDHPSWEWIGPIPAPDEIQAMERVIDATRKAVEYSRDNPALCVAGCVKVKNALTALDAEREKR